MGLTYLGPVDGHDMRQLGKVLQEAKRKQGPVLIHVLTEKGRGYEPAMRHPARFHGAAPYEIETGLPKSKGNPSYTDIFQQLCENSRPGTGCSGGIGSNGTGNRTETVRQYVPGSPV